jgi:hypothetical protein
MDRVKITLIVICRRPFHHNGHENASYRKPVARVLGIRRFARRHSLAVCAFAGPGGPCGWPSGIAPFWKLVSDDSEG